MSPALAGGFLTTAPPPPLKFYVCMYVCMYLFIFGCVGSSLLHADFGDAVVKNPPANAGDMGSSPGLGRSHMLRSN